MARFRYAAMDSGGDETTGEVTAEGRTQAAQMIRAKGLFPTRISELEAAGHKKGSVGSALKSGTKAKKKNAVTSFLTGRVKPRQLMTFTRQLATLIEAGLPLLRGLKILLKQEKTPGLRDALEGPRVALLEFVGRGVEADDLAVDLLLAQAAGDQLGDLGTGVEDGDPFGMMHSMGLFNKVMTATR